MEARILLPGETKEAEIFSIFPDEQGELLARERNRREEGMWIGGLHPLFPEEKKEDDAPGG